MPVIQTPLEKGFEKLSSPFQKFIQNQTSSSIILIACVVVALLIANSPWSHRYESLIETSIGFIVGDWRLNMNIRHWVNDGLMSLLTDLGSETLAIGIILVLVVGKAVGIPLFCWLTLRFNLGRLPSDMSMQHVVRPGLSGTFG